jgi:hypothetical protein
MTDDDVERLIAPFVDTRFYYDCYSDVSGASQDAVRHYNRNGWKEGRNPNPWFSTKEYLRLHRDVAVAGLNPLWHFVTTGRAEGRATRLVAKQEMGEPLPREVARKFFDANFYASKLGTHFASEDEALEHFLASGDRGLIDPSPHFSAEYYFLNVMKTPRVSESPLSHFVRKGRKAGTLANPMLQPKLNAIDSAKPADVKTREWLVAGKPSVLSEEALEGVLEELLLPDCMGFMLSVSHDDYLENVGGIQLCLAEEQRHAEGAGVNYIHVAPMQSRLTLDPEANPARIVLRISCNGEKIGTASAASILSVLKKLRDESSVRWVYVLHHLLGHSEAVVLEAAKRLRFDATYFWLHDYLFACEQYNLLRNDYDFCHAPPINSSACELCVHGQRRAAHLKQMARIFCVMKPHILAPSDSVASAWRRSSTLPHEGLSVVPHAKPIFKGKMVNYAAGGASVRPIRIAYVGYPLYHKGWPAFEQLAWAFSDDERYEFVHLGQQQKPGDRLPFYIAKATADDRDATIRALREAAVDVVMIWPAWPETFSIVTAEAVAAGAMVITHPGSGNCVALADKHGRALPFDTLSSLIIAMAGKEFYDKALEALDSGLGFGVLDYSQGLTVAFDYARTHRGEVLAVDTEVPKGESSAAKAGGTATATAEAISSGAPPRKRAPVRGKGGVAAKMKGTTQ